MAHSPHDALFRYTFSQPEHAAPLIKGNLSAGVAERIDWGSSELQSGSFVDTALSWRHSDLVFRAQLAGRPALLYVLMEHQSSTDPWMAFRVLSYVVRLWNTVLDAEPTRTTLPAVIPVVVHHGNIPWHAPRDLHTLIELDAALKEQLGEHLPQLRFVLDDLSGQTDDALRARALTQVGTLTAWALENLPGSRDPIGDLTRVIDLVRAVAVAPHGVDALTAVLRYVMEVSEPEPQQLKHFLQTTVGKPVTETLMSTAEKLREQGRAEGRTDIVLKLLTLKFGELPASAVQQVHKSSLEELERMAERVLTAKTLARALAIKKR